ncbi:carbohydrate-binding protein [uncultured Aquimarina sp.]|uniref:carbohydrate-binding protein n=1 Tax=uncultured Aquimarina sp. TaxID=575652 RepID=UPI002624FB55|nr:carbohydrate-binding protein [uncultured Aquimarina sp.]
MIFSKQISRILTFILFLIGGHIFAKDIFVAKNGNDDNSGTIDQPYLTINKAASVAVAGDVVYIREGTYEETLRPVNSGTAGNPITFQSYMGEKVIITAMEALNGFTPDGNGIYKTTTGWDLGQDNFVMNKTTVLDLARWPNNTDGDRFTLNSLRNDGGSQDNVQMDAFLTDSDIPNWNWSNGGSIMFYGDRPGSGWTTWRAWIKSQSAGRVNFDAIKNQNWIISAHPPGDLGDYFLEGIKEALDYQNEWYFDKDTKTLYVKLPNNEAPVDDQIQMARRTLTADLSNRNHITIKRMALFGGSVAIKGTGNTLHEVSLFYGSMTRGINPNFNSGANAVDIDWGSVDTVIEKCEIGYGDGTGVWDAGKGSLIKNNYIHNFDILGSYDAPIMARGGPNTRILNNKIERGGRDGIQIVSKNSEIAWNDVSRSNLIADDCGLIYIIGSNLNIEVHHNWFHDAYGRGNLKKAAGIYLDSSSETDPNPEKVRVYRNVVWNVEWTNIQINWNGTDIDVFNNTFVKNDGGTMGAWHKAGTSFTNVNVWNNITDEEATDQQGNQESESTWEPQSNRQNNLVNKTSFENYATNDFRLKANTPAIDFGREINKDGINYTAGFVGANPDVGAYELGDNWVPGVDWNTDEGPAGICYELPGETCESCTTPGVWYADTDNDGLGDPSSTQSSCSQPSGFVGNADDSCPTDNLNTCTIVHTIPGIIQAEEYTIQQGIERETTTDTGGGLNIGYIESGDYTEYQAEVNTAGTYDVSFRVASGTPGGSITVTSNGSTLGSATIGNTGGWQTWETVAITVDLLEGAQNIRFTYNGGTGFLYNINNFEFSNSTLSIGDFDINTLKIHPNPVKSSFFIQGLKENREFSIMDITGRVIKRFNTSGSQNEIHVSELTNGLYVLMDKTTNFSYKFVKKL